MPLIPDSKRLSERRTIIALAGIITAVVLVLGTLMPTITANNMVYATERASVPEQKPVEPKPVEPKPIPIPIDGIQKPCLTVVSDKTTFVDRGNTTVATSYPGWPTIPGATYIWSDLGFATGNPYTFTKPFILPPGFTYFGKVTINADDKWEDLRINGNFVADESMAPPVSWANLHSVTIPSTYFNPGFNTLTVKAVDLGRAYAGLAFKLEVYCKPTIPSTHWDKIVFTLNDRTTTNKTVGNTYIPPVIKPLLGKTLDIKVRDNPAEVAVLEHVVKGFLAAKYNLTKSDLKDIDVNIIEVEYAIDTNTYGLKPETPKIEVIEPQK